MIESIKPNSKKDLVLFSNFELNIKILEPRNLIDLLIMKSTKFSESSPQRNLGSVVMVLHINNETKRFIRSLLMLNVILPLS